MPLLPQVIVPFDCLDKRIKETWTEKRSRNLGNLPSPFRCVIVGPPGVGKSCVAKQLLIHQRPRFDQLFIAHGDYREDGSGSREYDDTDATAMFSEVPDILYWNEICSEDDPDAPPVKRLLVVDDIEMSGASKERLRNLATTFRYLSSHKGISVILCYQSWFDLPTVIKKCSNVFIIFKPRANSEYSLLDNRCGLPKGSLRELFRTIATGERDSIMVDHTPNSPTPIRLNIWTPVEIDAD